MQFVTRANVGCPGDCGFRPSKLQYLELRYSIQSVELAEWMVWVESKPSRCLSGRVAMQKKGRELGGRILEIRDEMLLETTVVCSDALTELATDFSAVR
jgi:hypothetical protein